MTRKIKWNARMTVGTIIGVISPFLFIPLTIGLIAWSQNFMFSTLWTKFQHDVMVQSKFISLSIIPNLIWFYMFLNRERYDIARGIIIGSALFLPYIVYINLIR
jgi:hypothetical protein